jgi:predicted RNA binding protein YcfA (HicA-like mRNA interferase family)
MSGKYPPLTCRDIKKALKVLGFKQRPSGATSHEQWVKFEGGEIHKVTVDCPKEPFGHDLIKSMAKQAGVTRDELYRAAGR